MRERGRCVGPGCRARGQHRHHVVNEQHVRAAGGDVRDPRNLVWVCTACHAAHHARRAPLQLWRLKEEVFEFAAELFGAEAAHSYLGRYYAAGDPRHDALLLPEASAGV